MKYKCNNCYYEAKEDNLKAHPCPVCGNVMLEFFHRGIKNTVGDHWITMDVTNGQLASFDPCDRIHRILCTLGYK